MLEREPEALKSDLGTGAADVARIVSEIRDRVQVELRPPGDPEDDRWRLFQSVTSFLRNAATVQPLLIVVEDLHWADRGTLDLLLHVARNLQGARMTIVGTYRDVQVDRTHPLSSALAELSRAASFVRIRLRGLTVDEVQRMMNNIRGQEVTWSRAEAIHRQTEGNPLFVQEVLRYLVEEGLVVREGGRYVRTDAGGPPEAGIPEGLRDVIGKRLSHLSQETNRLLSIAAVIGREFRLETLRAIANLDEEPLIASLDEAVKVGVLEERSQVGGVHYRFAHAFFRQTLYEELSAPRRLRLHQEVARALEGQYAARRQEHAAELAEHFANSTDREDLAKAVEYGELAAQRAMSVFDYGEAVRLLERALDVQEVLDPDDKARRCDLLLALGEGLLRVEEPLRVAQEVAEEARTLAEALGDEERAGQACQLALEALPLYGGSPMLASSALRRWAGLADRFAASGTVARVYADIALAQVEVGREEYADAWSLAERALGLARELGDAEALFEAASILIGSINSYAPKHQESRRRLAEEFIVRAQTGPSTRAVSSALNACAAVLLSFGERIRAEEAWRQQAELAQRIQDSRLLRSATHYVDARLAFVDGRLEDALQAASRIANPGIEPGAHVSGQQAAAEASTRLPLLYLGRVEEALATVGRLQEVLSINESAFSRTMRALFLAHLGRAEDARAVLRHVFEERHIEPVDDGRMGVQLLVYLLHAAVLVRDSQVAEVLVARLAALPPMSVASGNANGLTCPARHIGAAAALLGKPDEARAYYQQALELCAKIRFRPEIALTRLQLAELLLEHYPDERAEALDHLDFAIAEFREMKMQPSLERALRHRGLLKA